MCTKDAYFFFIFFVFGLFGGLFLGGLEGEEHPKDSLSNFRPNPTSGRRKTSKKTSTSETESPERRSRRSFQGLFRVP